jgi:hypothetical protein
MADKASVLVMANRTAESPELLEALKERAAQGNAEFTLLIPSTPHGLSWAADMSSGEGEAEHHKIAFLEELREEGIDVKDAKVGDPDPLAAAQDAVNMGSFDEVIVSTLPLKISKWLKLDMPSKVRAATGLPVTHIVASDAKQR